MTEDETAKLRARIADRLASLETEESTAQAGREHVTLDQTSVGRLSRMDALQRQAMAQATARRRAAEIARLTDAARRLADAPGEFGWCEECGEPVGMRRLEADPTLRLCIECMRGA
ncbi:MAG: TraR/DksA C4-type zinc finger protein [Pseudomonadota bacterium]